MLCVDCTELGFDYIESVNGCYFPLLRNLKWKAAHQYCREYGGHLLIIGDEAEQNAVAQYLDGPGGQYQYHIRYHSGAVESTDSML